MGYALDVRYGEDETVRVPLPDLDADQAELARQSLLREVEHALALEAPVVYSGATDADPQAGVPIDPNRVTEVDLIED